MKMKNRILALLVGLLMIAGISLASASSASAHVCWFSPCTKILNAAQNPWPIGIVDGYGQGYSWLLQPGSQSYVDYPWQPDVDAMYVGSGACIETFVGSSTANTPYYNGVTRGPAYVDVRNWGGWYISGMWAC